MNDQQIERYARHILLAEVGGRGQQRLLDATVAVTGASAGSDTAAVYLCAAGVGTLRLDPELAKRRSDDLHALNSDCTVTDVAGPADMTITPKSTRLDGSLAAHRVIMTLSGASEPAFAESWTIDRRGGRWD